MYIPEVVPDEDREIMVEESHHGKEIEMGENVAILVVDMTKEFVEDRYPNGHAETGKPAVEAISRLLEVGRSSRIRGFFSRALYPDHSLKSGRWMDTVGSRGQVDDTSEMTELADGIAPGEDDLVFGKYKPSAFFGTQLNSMLTYDGIDTLIITGMTTSGCVRASTIDAFSNNYRVIIPIECVADRSQISHEISLFDLDMKYADVRPLDAVIDRLR